MKVVFLHLNLVALTSASEEIQTLSFAELLPRLYFLVITGLEVEQMRVDVYL